MKTVPRRFYLHSGEPKLEMNPFIKNYIEFQYKDGRLPDNTLRAFEEDEFCRVDEIVAEPEEVLNFDAQYFPESYSINIPFPKRGFDGMTGFCAVRRVKNELLYSMSVHIEGQLFFTYPLSMARLSMEVWNYCERDNLIGDLFMEDISTHSLRVHYIGPAEGNMLDTFNKAWKSFETLYYEARQRIISDVNNMAKEPE